MENFAIVVTLVFRGFELNNLKSYFWDYSKRGNSVSV
jgi:hypothetical protein